MEYWSRWIEHTIRGGVYTRFKHAEVRGSRLWREQGGSPVASENWREGWVEYISPQAAEEAARWFMGIDEV